MTARGQSIGNGNSEAGSSAAAVAARQELQSGFRYRAKEAWWYFAEGGAPALP
jgi:hypothetical protein